MEIITSQESVTFHKMSAIKSNGKPINAIIEMNGNEFRNCQFSCCGKYDLEDWKFMHEVSKKILELSNPL